jgi:hypothetical protein
MQVPARKFIAAFCRCRVSVIPHFAWTQIRFVDAAVLFYQITDVARLAEGLRRG